MTQQSSKKLVVAISSRALFDLDASHEIFEKQGLEAFAKHQIAHENKPLEPGLAFNLVKKLLALQDSHTQQPLVEVILLSRNSADTGLRIFNSIRHYKLGISRAAFSNGQSPYPYMRAFATDLFLSAHTEDVREALNANMAAAKIFSGTANNYDEQQLKIAFDGDAVIFSDESERIFQENGLDAFVNHEQDKAFEPMTGGPFKAFLQALVNIQKQFPSDGCPIRTALITARAAPTHERVIRTLRAWDIRIDEAIFLGGLDKGDFLKAFQADFFFDDQPQHCQSASQYVATGHVTHGVKNT